LPSVTREIRVPVTHAPPSILKAVVEHPLPPEPSAQESVMDWFMVCQPGVQPTYDVWGPFLSMRIVLPAELPSFPRASAQPIYQK